MQTRADRFKNEQTGSIKAHVVLIEEKNRNSRVPAVNFIFLKRNLNSSIVGHYVKLTYYVIFNYLRCYVSIIFRFNTIANSVQMLRSYFNCAILLLAVSINYYNKRCSSTRVHVCFSDSYPTRIVSFPRSSFFLSIVYNVNLIYVLTVACFGFFFWRRYFLR